VSVGAAENATGELSDDVNEKKEEKREDSSNG
jgi:hypothetical protein